MEWLVDFFNGIAISGYIVYFRWIQAGFFLVESSNMSFKSDGKYSYVICDLLLIVLSSTVKSVWGFGVYDLFKFSDYAELSDAPPPSLCSSTCVREEGRGEKTQSSAF